MYQVLYRKWRPKTFDDVVGQDTITTTIKNELLSGRIAHAYLFTGSRGTGKTTCAKILAKAINCLNSSDGNPCLTCENCVGIENGSVTDIMEIDAASNNGVENIRTLREESVFTPAIAKYRVYIIDEVHMLSIGAFNALLKTLEEPSDHVVFILATTEVHKLPATILSRCQRFDFNRIPTKSIAKRLIFVSENENITLDYNAATLIAKLSDGALRDALSILDQCIVKVSSQNSKSDIITKDIVSEIVGLSGKEYIFSLTDAIINNDASTVLSIVNDLYSASKNLSKLCDELLEHFRNMMIIKSVNDPQKLSNLLDEQDSIASSQAEKIALSRLLYIMEVLQSCMQKLPRSLNVRTEFELYLIKMCDPSLDTTQSALLNRIIKLEESLALGNLPTPQSESTKTKTYSDKSEEIDESSKVINSNNTDVDVEDLRSNAVLMKDWTAVLDQLKQHSIALFSAFKNSTAYLSGNFVLVDTDNEFAFALLRESAKRDEMRLAIQQVTGKKFRLGPFKKPKPLEQSHDHLDEFEDFIKSTGIELKKK